LKVKFLTKSEIAQVVENEMQFTKYLMKLGELKGTEKEYREITESAVIAGAKAQHMALKGGDEKLPNA
jgi:hypothetical protein